jgi:drug/metabolite transporter (DMT)-like permease
MVPIGDCIAIIYSSPILTSLLSWWLLGETLPSEFPLQVFLVLSGNMLIVDPPFVHGLPTFTSSDSSIAYLVLFIALALAAVLPVVTAKTKACSWIEVEHVGAAVASAVLIPGLMFADYAVYGAVPSIPTESPLDAVNIILAALGTFGGVALETKGYQLASAGRASMFRNLEVPFAYALQRWSTVTPVAPRALLGALLIVMSCGIGGITSRFWQSSETQQLSSKVGLEGIESDEVPLVDATLKV